MPNKMLIDASHPEETRVVVLRGNRVEEFDFESANRKQLRGNIYLAKVTRVEPSLQAAFVDYGGNRHGFLAFSEIHPDYYQIPVADRQALIAEQERRHQDDEAEHERRSGRRNRGGGRHRNRAEHRRDETVRSDALPADEMPRDNAELTAGEQALGGVPTDHPFTADAASGQPAHDEQHGDHAPDAAGPQRADDDDHHHDDVPDHAHHAHHDDRAAAHERAEGSAENSPVSEGGHDGHYDSPAESAEHGETAQASAANTDAGPQHGENGGDAGAENNGEPNEEDAVESVGGADALEEAQERAPRVRTRQYKIQEVIKRRQVMLVQVVKEERGTKGAALTTYLSLAGRYSVLMPNTSRGGGISRKITSAEDRSRLKEIAQDLEVPEGMGVILRTAGASRTKIEVKRDFEYLLRLWETVRDLTLKSTAPTLVYEEGSLVKRSIRDLYNKDIDEIIVAGDHGYQEAKEFMRMLMPSHAKNVRLYRDSQPVFTRYGIESQLDAMFTPVVQLRSGGYIVLNQAEALVAIDVNSGRATREHHIEDTALKTNIEAAEEVARQLRLRDLAGLIVIDFIDMDEGRNNRTVERRLKEALKHDRARIQVGRISHFGLLEMSRQRIRTSVLESSTDKCPVCGGSGHVRSVSSVTLALLRAIEETLIKGATHNLIVRTRPEVALYILNQKRGHLRELEERFRISVTVNADPAVVGTQSYVIDRGEQVHTPEAARAIAAAAQPETTSPIVEEEEAADALAEATAPEDEEAPEEAGGEQGAAADEGDREPADEAGEPHGDEQQEGDHRRGGHRRRRRGGRGRGRGGERTGREERAPRGEQFAREPGEPGYGLEVAPDHVQAGGGNGEHAPQQNFGDGGEGRDGNSRRRRRGRRGGRRNRHRNGDNGGHRPQNDMQSGEDFSTTGAGPAPLPRESYAPPPAVEERVEAAPPPPPASGPAPEAAPAQRRRSTIREAAPTGESWSSAPSSSAPAPASPAAPVVSSSGSEELAQPKRGWWGRKLLGDK